MANIPKMTVPTIDDFAESTVLRIIRKIIRFTQELTGKTNEIITHVNQYDDRIISVETKNNEQDTEIATIKEKNVEQDTEIANIKIKDVSQDEEITGLTHSVVSDLTGNFDNEKRNLHLSIEREQAESIDLDVVIPAQGTTGTYSPGEGIAISDTNVISISSDLDTTIKQLKISDEENTSAIAQAQKDISANATEVASLKSTVAQHTNQIGSCFNEFSVADGKLSMTNVQGQTYEQSFGESWTKLDLSKSLDELYNIVININKMKIVCRPNYSGGTSSSWTTAPSEISNITLFSSVSRQNKELVFEEHKTDILPGHDTFSTTRFFTQGVTLSYITTYDIIYENNLSASNNENSYIKITLNIRSFNAGGNVVNSKSFAKKINSSTITEGVEIYYQ